MKSTNQKPAGLLQPLPIPSSRWGSVSMDLITAPPETKSGNTAIVDRLSKMTHLAACSTSTLALRILQNGLDMKSTDCVGYLMSSSVTGILASLATS